MVHPHQQQQQPPPPNVSAQLLARLGAMNGTASLSPNLAALLVRNLGLHDPTQDEFNAGSSDWFRQGNPNATFDQFRTSALLTELAKYMQGGGAIGNHLGGQLAANFGMQDFKKGAPNPNQGNPGGRSPGAQGPGTNPDGTPVVPRDPGLRNPDGTLMTGPPLPQNPGFTATQTPVTTPATTTPQPPTKNPNGAPGVLNSGTRNTPTPGGGASSAGPGLNAPPPPAGVDNSVMAVRRRRKNPGPTNPGPGGSYF